VKPKGLLLSITLGIGIGLVAGAASGQQLIIKGMYGMMSGTMAPPGTYAGMFGAINWADTYRTPEGDSLKGPNVTQEIFGPLVMWVSNFKILGADYAATLAVPFANARVEFPRPTMDLSGSTGIALSQLYVVPFTLGWHIKDPLPLAPGGADVTFHYAFFAPTGRYTAGASDNTSLGMWCNELSARLTAFFDKDKAWHGSAALFYDINSKKKDQDWTTGNPFTFMGGLGRNFGSSDSYFSGWAGIAGYGQWQVTSTTGQDAPLIMRENKTTIYGIGPEITALKGALTVRYFWQYGGKFSTQGQGLYVQFAMPLPL
jgi:hypothetical protein